MRPQRNHLQLNRRIPRKIVQQPAQVRVVRPRRCNDGNFSLQAVLANRDFVREEFYWFWGLCFLCGLSLAWRFLNKLSHKWPGIRSEICKRRKGLSSTYISSSRLVPENFMEGLTPSK